MAVLPIKMAHTVPTKPQFHSTTVYLNSVLFYFIILYYTVQLPNFLCRAMGRRKEHILIEKEKKPSPSSSKNHHLARHHPA